MKLPCPISPTRLIAGGGTTLMLGVIAMTAVIQSAGAEAIGVLAISVVLFLGLTVIDVEKLVFKGPAGFEGAITARREQAEEQVAVAAAQVVGATRSVEVTDSLSITDSITPEGPGFKGQVDLRQRQAVEALIRESAEWGG